MSQNSRRRVPGLFVALAVFGLLSGCEHRKYEVSMRRLPDGKVARELMVGTEDDGNPKETPKPVLEALRKIYGEGESQPNERTHFKGTFSGAIPADTSHHDVAGHGVVTTVASPLGVTCYYLERVPGPADPLAVFEAARDTLDTTLKALQAHLESLPEIRGKTELIARLKTFLLTDLRRDALNFMLLAWPAFQPNAAGAGDAHREREEYEVWARVFAYLHERGYVDDVHFAGLSFDRIILGGVRRRLAPVLGDSAKELAPLVDAFLSEDSTLGDAIEHGLTLIGVKKEDYDARLALAFNGTGDSTTIELSWKTPLKPSRTNGEWDSAANKITWRVDAVTPPWLPPAMYAVWPEPNEPFQKAHFGRVLISDALVDYNEWRGGLKDGERERWDAFVAGLSPAQPLADRLKEFESAETKLNSPTATQPSVGPLERGIELLREASKPN